MRAGLFVAVGVNHLYCDEHVVSVQVSGTALALPQIKLAKAGQPRSPISQVTVLFVLLFKETASSEASVL